MTRISDFRLRAWGLERILFSSRPPEPRYLPRVFSSRESELDLATSTVFDVPRNLLVNGLFGVGKTTFVEALIYDLRERHSNEVLCIYECLDSAVSDLKTTILRGLAQALRQEDEEAREIDRLLSGIESTIQQLDKGSGSGEINLGFAKVGGGGESSVTESLSRKQLPNAAYQIQKLVERALQRQPNRRLIVAVDDLDKRDPESVRLNLADARSTLHTDCSFIFTGHPLSILRDAYSSVGGIFDLQLELKVLPNDAMRQIIINYLETGRRPDAQGQGQGLHPFTEEAAEAIIHRAFGIPRVLNGICLHILNKASEMRRPVIDLDTLRECWQKSGHHLKRAISPDVRNLLEILSQQPEGLDPSEVSDDVFDRLGVDSYQSLLNKCNQMMQEDWIIGVEKDGKSRFLPQPLLQPLPVTDPPIETTVEPGKGEHPQP